MGIFASCCGSASYSCDDEDYPKHPSNASANANAEDKRKQILEAAERRQREQEGRGLHHPKRVKERQRRMEELEKKQEQMPNYQQGGEGLKWQIN